MFGNIIFRQLFDAASSTYTYVVGDPQSMQAVIIDTVFEQHFRDSALAEELGLKLLAVLDTHCHADHVTGTWLMQQATGCRVGAVEATEIAGTVTHQGRNVGAA